MKTLLIRFEKDFLHHILIENLKINDEITNNEKTPLTSLRGEGEKYSKIISELKLLTDKNKPDLIIYHAAQKNKFGIDEVRFSNEAFLNYFCFINKVAILPINKILGRQIMNIKQKDFTNLYEEKYSELVSTKVLAKSNKILELLVLVLITKDKI